MRSVDASPSYSQGNEAEFRREVTRNITRNYGPGRDVFITFDQRACIQSPNGTWYRIVVSNAGALSTEVITP